MWWNEHGLESWTLSGIAIAIVIGFAHGPLGTWLAYGIGWTLCAFGLDDPGCSFY